MQYIRRPDPFIETRTVKKKAKKHYKENVRRARRKYYTPKPPVPYSERTEKQREQLKLNSIKHSLRATKGDTPRARAIRRRRRREYLRIKYKMQNLLKKCTICKETKALSDFDYLRDKKHTKRYRRTYCYICRKKMNAEYYRRKR